MRGIEVPPGLDSQRHLGPDWGDWLDRLPRIAADLVEDWSLRLDGDAMYGFCSLVLPVRQPDDAEAVLKVSFDLDDESEYEGLALQRWGGEGAVRLLRADPRRRALLLERIGPGDLGSLWDVDACEVVAGLYSRIHLPAPPQLRTLTSYVARWDEGLAAQPPTAPIPHRLVDQARSLTRDLLDDPASTGVMIHGDLHHHNVLTAEREPWLVIDPKPMSGDPHYEPAPMLWNLWEDVVGGPGGVRDGVRRRFHALVDAGGLDEDRARAWVVVRMVQNASWSVEDAARMSRDLSADERDWITRCIAIVKAVQD